MLLASFAAIVITLVVRDVASEPKLIPAVLVGSSCRECLLLSEMLMFLLFAVYDLDGDKVGLLAFVRPDWRLLNLNFHAIA